MTDAPPDLTPTGCRLTLHVLDVAAGHPAAGVAVALAGMGPEGEDDLGTVSTDADGRSSGPDGAWSALAAGTYELRVDLGAHFRATAPGGATFYEVVPVRFLVGPTDGHVHVALLASPWSYTTYRGS
jgi:hydroxyisourate hydrolase